MVLNKNVTFFWTPSTSNVKKKKYHFLSPHRNENYTGYTEYDDGIFILGWAMPSKNTTVRKPVYFNIVYILL